MSARRHIVPIFVPHAGCPHDCVFCDQKRISGSLYPATAQTVHSILNKLPPRADRELAFYGGSFTAIPGEEQEALLSAAQPFLSDGRIGCIRVSTRPDAVTPVTLARLKRYGVAIVELGAQSMDDRVLRLSGRGHTAQDIKAAAGLVRESGFTLILQMMTGLPGSDGESDVESARQIASLAPDGVRIYPTVILRDTALAELWAQGRYKEHTVEDAVAVCARIVPVMEEHGIPVIRLGLNPSEELSGGGALGGAYHPALGELILSRIWLDNARKLLRQENRLHRVVLGVPTDRISVMIGQHRENILCLEREFSLDRLTVKGIPGQKIPVYIVERVAKEGKRDYN